MMLSAIFYQDGMHIYIQTGRFPLNYRVWIAKFFRDSAPYPIFPYFHMDLQLIPSPRHSEICSGFPATGHISMFIFATCIFSSYRLVTDTHSILYIIAGLTIVLYVCPFNFSGTLLLRMIPIISFHNPHPA